LGAGLAVDKTAAKPSTKGNDMAAEINPQTSNDPNLNVHVRDYTKFIGLLKWSIVIIAIIAAVVIYIISN